MSKQLSFSAALSIFAMAAFALLATPDFSLAADAQQTGAKTEVSAPAMGRVVSALTIISE